MKTIMQLFASDLIRLAPCHDLSRVGLSAWRRMSIAAANLEPRDFDSLALGSLYRYGPAEGSGDLASLLARKKHGAAVSEVQT